MVKSALIQGQEIVRSLRSVKCTAGLREFSWEARHQMIVAPGMVRGKAGRMTNVRRRWAADVTNISAVAEPGQAISRGK